MKHTWKESVRLPHGNKECWRLYVSSKWDRHFTFSSPTGWYVEKEPIMTPFRYWCVDTTDSASFPSNYGPFTSLSDAQQFALSTYLIGE